ncbi:MAG: flagellar motor switch protein FliM [Candidatus Hydrogenedentes bacterium]|nr:flagellar motor switch protein FliM [Candidatus Hydrogenedentota bacterium]
MADILSQEEVDMLLSAVTEGDLGSDLPAPAATVEEIVLSTYDFRRPERVSKEQLKGLQSLFEALARELSILLPPFLRTAVHVDLTSIDQLTYDEFILSVARPTSMSIIDMTPLEGRSILELNPAMVFPIVDRVLGGKGSSLSAPRELTEIEDRIVYRIVLMVLDSWKRAWEHLVEFKMGVSNQESDPLIVQIVAGSEMVIRVGYEVYIGETVGSMNICVPLMVLNPILDQISSQVHFQRHVSEEAMRNTRAQITQTVGRAGVTVEPILGKAKLRLSDVARLQVGDVVPLDTNHEGPVPVLVGGIIRFLAKPGRRGEQSSVQVMSVVRE